MWFALAYMTVNLIAFLLMYYDKQCAKSSAWRVPEKVLLEVAALGGGVGATLGMFRFRHKTKHWYFRCGLPILAGIQIGLIVCLLVF